MEKASKAYLKKVREISTLREKRTGHGLFAVEGQKIIRDMISKGYTLDSVLASYNYAQDEESYAFIEEIEARNIPVFYTGKMEYSKVTSLRNPEGIMALAAIPDHKEDISWIDRKETLIVLLDSVQDPGNLGAIIRSSVAFGSSAIILTGETQDIYSPKVVRASSGMVLDISVSGMSYPDIEKLTGSGFVIFATGSGTPNSVSINDIGVIPSKLIIAFGNEGEGLSPSIMDIAKKTFYIPISDKAESLNVSSAVAIALFEIGRLKYGR
ncbi:MAG: RNA methyltransferase [Candidatus Omnitrophica bacterium]|nr:RNA methyltransferase [Candidatus Omnitrophota bacterium]